MTRTLATKHWAHDKTAGSLARKPSLFFIRLRMHDRIALFLPGCHSAEL